MANTEYDFAVSEASSSATGGVNTAEGQDPSTVNDGLRAWKQLRAARLDDEGGVNTVTGTGDAVAITLAEGFTAYGTGAGQIDTGAWFRFIAGAANTTAATLNINGIGTKAIRKISGGTDVALVAGDLAAGETYTVVYRSTANSAAGAWVLVSVPPVAATASAPGIVGLTQLGLAYNVGMAATVGSSALTVSLKGADGNDPSATNPVVIPFRNATLATGTPVLRTVTAATSIVVASTKTLGSASGVAFRLWVVAVDTGSGIELGLVNCVSSQDIMTLPSSDLYSPTATPGNSAQVIYTTSGQTSKPICVLGYLDFSSGEATAGTWATAADRIQVRNLGTKMPGDVVQVRSNFTGAMTTGTTTVPNDDTIPQITEGTEWMTRAITPLAAANMLHVFSGAQQVPSATAAEGVLALFRDAGANALATTFIQLDSYRPAYLEWYVLAGSTSATTFRIRGGSSAANTITFNGSGGVRRYGGTANSFLKVEEIMG